MTIKNILGVALILLLPLAQANALVLDNWNDTNLDGSDDMIVVQTGFITEDIVDIGTVITQTWFSMQWLAGADDSPGAQGIDQVYYNYSGSTGTGDVLSVWEGAIGTGTDVTADWTLNMNNVNSGGGFGNLNSGKNKEPSGDNGIDPSILFFLLDGDVTFAPNTTHGSTFTAHVRYYEDCSGWVSNGTTTSEDDNSCGSRTVPEPDMVGMLAIGLLGMVVARRKMKV